MGVLLRARLRVCPAVAEPDKDCDAAGEMDADADSDADADALPAALADAVGSTEALRLCDADAVTTALGSADGEAASEKELHALGVAAATVMHCVAVKLMCDFPGVDDADDKSDCVAPKVPVEEVDTLPEGGALSESDAVKLDERDAHALLEGAKELLLDMDRLPLALPESDGLPELLALWAPEIDRVSVRDSVAALLVLGLGADEGEMDSAAETDGVTEALGDAEATTDDDALADTDTPDALGKGLEEAPPDAEVPCESDGEAVSEALDGAERERDTDAVSVTDVDCVAAGDIVAEADTKREPEPDVDAHALMDGDDESAVLALPLTLPLRSGDALVESLQLGVSDAAHDADAGALPL